MHYAMKSFHLPTKGYSAIETIPPFLCNKAENPQSFHDLHIDLNTNKIQTIGNPNEACLDFFHSSWVSNRLLGDLPLQRSQSSEAAFVHQVTNDNSKLASTYVSLDRIISR